MRSPAREVRSPEPMEKMPEPMPHASSKSQRGGLLDAPPKTTFLLGLFAGIAATAVTFLLLGAPTSEAKPSVKGTAQANTNPVAAPTAPAEPTADATKITPPTKADHYRGVEPEKAKVVLVEYSDFQCPFCNRIHPTLQRMVDENKDSVSWVYRHYPLTSIHPQAQPAANAAECAAEQGKFWEFGDELFENQSSLGDALFTRLASELGLNEKKFSDCTTSKKYDSVVSGQLSEGDAAGVTGTPATFVLKGTDLASGELISGALPYETFNSVVAGLLK